MANRLTGMRLGRHERFLLSHAGSSLGITPLVIDPAEAPRSTQQGLLRAALKLESAGLIERHPVYKEQRARDPRRERPHFHAGRFWTYTDPSRRLYVRRIAIWRTNFGEGILQEFLVELQLARPIRWDDRRVARAEAWARQHTPDGGTEQGSRGAAGRSLPGTPSGGGGGPRGAARVPAPGGAEPGGSAALVACRRAREAGEAEPRLRAAAAGGPGALRLCPPQRGAAGAARSRAQIAGAQPQPPPGLAAQLGAGIGPAEHPHSPVPAAHHLITASPRRRCRRRNPVFCQDGPICGADLWIHSGWGRLCSRGPSGAAEGPGPVKPQQPTVRQGATAGIDGVICSEPRFWAR